MPFYLYLISIPAVDCRQRRTTEEDEIGADLETGRKMENNETTELETEVGVALDGKEKYKIGEAERTIFRGQVLSQARCNVCRALR